MIDVWRRAKHLSLLVGCVVLGPACKPAAGTPGPPGTNGTSVTAAVEPPGANCPNGGTKLTDASGSSFVCSAIGTGGTIQVDQGTALAPSVFFNSNVATGMFSPSPGAFGITTNGKARFVLDSAGDISITGDADHTLMLTPNPTAGGAGHGLTLLAGTPALGATDQLGGDLTLAAGEGTGLAGGGNLHVMTAGPNGTSGTTSNLLVDRRITVGKSKALTLTAPGFTSLMSIHLVGTNTAGGRIAFMIRATDGGSQIATEEGVIQYLATANSITCTVQATDTLHLGTVNAGCTPGFFNPGSQPGVSIFDNVTFGSPAAIVVNEVYFEVANQSGSAIRLEP